MSSAEEVRDETARLLGSLTSPSLLELSDMVFGMVDANRRLMESIEDALESDPVLQYTRFAEDADDADVISSAIPSAPVVNTGEMADVCSDAPRSPPVAPSADAEYRNDSGGGALGVSPTPVEPHKRLSAERFAAIKRRSGSADRATPASPTPLPAHLQVEPKTPDLDDFGISAFSLGFLGGGQPPKISAEISPFAASPTFSPAPQIHAAAPRVHAAPPPPASTTLPASCASAAPAKDAANHTATNKPPSPPTSAPTPAPTKAAMPPAPAPAPAVVKEEEAVEEEKVEEVAPVPAAERAPPGGGFGFSTEGAASKSPPAPAPSPPKEKEAPPQQEPTAAAPAPAPAPPVESKENDLPNVSRRGAASKAPMDMMGGDNLFPLMREVTPEEFAAVPDYLRSQISCEDLNRAVKKINDLMTDKRFDPDSSGSSDSLSMDEMQKQLKLGLKTKAFVLLLMNLTRVKTLKRGGAIVYGIVAC